MYLWMCSILYKCSKYLLAISRSLLRFIVLLMKLTLINATQMVTAGVSTLYANKSCVPGNILSDLVDVLKNHYQVAAVLLLNNKSQPT